MKGYKKILVTILLSLIITSVQVLAAQQDSPPNVQLVGDANGIVFIPGDEPFLNKSNMLPGDSVSRVMDIENKYSVPYELFIKAERITPVEKYDLLNKLQLKITYNNKVIYQGATSGEDGLENNISLGTYKPGDKGVLKAEVVLDGPSTGNDYMNKNAEVEWIFTATNNETKGEVGTTSKTGDENSILPYIFLLGLSVALGLKVVINKVKGKEGLNEYQKK